MITDSRSLLTETKSSRKESSFPAEMPLIKSILVANRQSPVIARKFLPLCHRNTSLGCVLTNAIGRENLLKCQLDSFILCNHVLAPTYLPPRRSEYVFTLHQTMAQNLCDMWRSTFEIRTAQFPTVTEIALKSPFVCLNRSTIR